jgi:ATP-dependent Clp protease protease subunit
MRIDVKGIIISNDDKWIYDWFDMESTTPKDINTALEKANGQSIDVYINSGGGDIFAGSEIYTAIKSYKGEINIHVVGLAASAASVIAMAGKSDISPTAMLMVHNVSGGAQGDYHTMDKTSDVLQTANKAIASAYVAKTKMSEKDALAMMDKETWLTAQQAVDKGLIDKVMFENTQLVASYNSGMLPKSVIDKIRNTINNPLKNEADFFIQQKALQAKLKLINLGGKNNE